MPDSVIITKTYSVDHWIVSAEVVADEHNVIPQEVFIYENTGTVTLGDYQGVCSFEELQRLRVWDGSIIPVFGNRFVRYHRVETHLSPGSTPDKTESLIVSGLSSLKAELLSDGNVSTIHTV